MLRNRYSNNLKKRRRINRESLFWFLILLLLFVPLINSFVSNIQKLFKTMITNIEYKETQDKLLTYNKKLLGRLRYYETKDGIKTLVKERLDKVEKGESLIKFEDFKKPIE